MRAATATRAPATGRGTRRAPLVPDQHGAWGFLLLPAVLGVVAGGWSAAVAVLLAAWVAAYPVSWALTGLLAAPRGERFRRTLAVWAAVALPTAVAAVALRPWLLWLVPLYAGAWAVNLWFARQRRERALGNDLVLVGECTAAVTIFAAAAEATGWAVPLAAMTELDVLVLTLCCALTLVGSTLHVKSLIRERRDPRYARASRCYAVAAVAVVAVVVVLTDVGVLLVAPFVAQAGRAFAVRDPSIRPARIGMVELASLVLLAGCAAVAV